MLEKRIKIFSGLLLLLCFLTVGLWPDVGFAYKAATMPCPVLGLFLGLTGAKLRSPSDLLATNIATHYIPEQQLEVCAMTAEYGFTHYLQSAQLHTNLSA